MFHTSRDPFPVSFTVTGDFRIESSTCRDILDAEDGNCFTRVQFQPTGLGPRTGTLSAAGATNSVSLSGVGIGKSKGKKCKKKGKKGKKGK